MAAMTAPHPYTPDDFRIRKTPAGYRLWQRVGSGWEALSEVYGSRADARTAVNRIVIGTGHS